MDAVSLQARLRTYLQLARPANVVTAWADVLAGFAASGAALGVHVVTTPPDGWALAGLLLSTTGLYAGGVVFNDFFDAALDARERPERPIPSGRISRQEAMLLGSALLWIGVFAAALVSWTSGLLAAAVAAGALLYDAHGKHHPVAGPLNMGACRGGNLLLGASAVPATVGALWFLALLPLAYIAAVTAISRGEVHGGTQHTGVLALSLVGAVVIGLLLLGLLPGYSVLHALPVMALFTWQVVPPFLAAARAPRPAVIRNAVKTGVLALITLNAALAAGFGGWLYALVILALWPLSYGLGRVFAVT